MGWRWYLERQETIVDNDVGITHRPTSVTTAQSSSPTVAPSTGQNADAGDNKNDALGEEGKRYIVFDLSDLNDERVLDLTSASQVSPMIRWTVNTSVDINSVRWQGQDNSDGNGYEEIAQVKAREMTDDNGRMQVDQNGASLDLSKFADEPALRLFLGNPMVLEIGWSSTGTELNGTTTSGIFTVADLAQESENFEQDFSRKVNATSQTREGQEKLSTDAGEDETDNSTVDTAPTMSGSGGATALPTLSTSDTVDSSESRGGGGLSTGAIAGIAVAAAVIFLALVGGLVFWMLRRRRQNRNRGQYNKPTNSTTFVGGDKEVNQVTETPHPSYSNDRHVPLSNLAGAGASPATIGPSEGQYAPYRDDDDNGYESPDKRPRTTDGAGTPYEVSSSVAHLVEEGMTAEEIRRLEEEERQLDDAIQRHEQGR
ncbi:hypothetical protein NLU13_3238 [Sarocladium strictum]|uniref:Uncharacterized protein n=1 Tax=Sarocladium strictum TaxID=5046 RepID=A0AA39GLM1_SARSR|nr:hypothetical protein NLU13_3238 [Sarocladium strictum]